MPGPMQNLNNNYFLTQSSQILTVFVGYCCSARFIDSNTKTYMVTLIGQGHITGRFPKSGFEPRQSDSIEGKLVWKPAKGKKCLEASS